MNNICLVLKRLPWWLSPLRPLIILLWKEYISRKIRWELVVIALFRKRGKCCSWRNLGETNRPNRHLSRFETITTVINSLRPPIMLLWKECLLRKSVGSKLPRYYFEKEARVVLRKNMGRSVGITKITFFQIWGCKLKKIIFWCKS